MIQGRMDIFSSSLRALCPLLLGLAAAAQEAAPIQIKASEIYLGGGNRIENGVLLLEEGRIKRIGRGVEIDPALPLIEHDGVVTAGMIACQGQTGAGGEAHDSTRSVLPEARMAHAFRPGHSDFESALKAGITSVVLAPSAQNVVGGLTSVVKTSGGRVLKADAHLALSFSQRALEGGPSGGFILFGQASSNGAADGGPEDTQDTGRGARYPTSYAGAMSELRARFENPQGPFVRAAQGELPVLIDAWERHEVMRAAEFAQSLRLKGMVRGAPLAGDEHVLQALVASGLGVVLGPFSPQQTAPSLAGFRRLSEAGVPVAFGLGEYGSNPMQLRMGAVKALLAGADPVALWNALTTEAARLAGVSEQVGSLERGRDADLVLWSGNPLDLASRVEAVFVDGRLVHRGDSQ